MLINIELLKTQTELEEENDSKKRDSDPSRVLRILQKRGDLMEEAILENIYTNAFESLLCF